jgi:SecD/SecF fusion protein
VLGSGAIKGFAVTLTLGLLASMFTAIYVTRTILEAWVRRGRVQKIHMLGAGRPPKIAWMRLRRTFIPISIALMVASVGLFVASKDETVYDIDFTGGMKLQARFAAPTTVDEAKAALAGEALEVEIPRETPDADGARTRKVRAGPYEGAQVVTVGGEGDWLEIKVPRVAQDGTPAGLTDREQIESLKAYVRAREPFKSRLVPHWLRRGPTTYTWAAPADETLKGLDGRLTARVTLEDPKRALTPEALETALETARPYYTFEGEGGRRVKHPAAKVTREVTVREVVDPGEPGGKDRTFDLWLKAEDSAGTSVETDPERLREELREFLAGAAFRTAIASGAADADDAQRVALTDPFPLDDLIGAGVAHRQRNAALLAILLSFVGIVGYVAFRFRSYAMGFAAVFCLVHDVCIALGAVCLVDHLGIVDAKISLGIVAAFLTIVGFSVNDTVVTFDRIRELRGRAPTVSASMIEDAVNQTFSRTIRTALTVFLTVLVLFVMNLGQRSVLEGLSFTLMIGIVSGTYSTVGMAAPLLLFLPWFWARVRPYRPRTKVLAWALKAPGLYVLGALSLGALVAAWLISHEPMLAAFYGLLVVPFALTLGLWAAWAAAFALASFVAMMALLVPWSFREDAEAALEADRRSGALPAPEPEPAPEPTGGWGSGGPARRRGEKGPGMQSP